MSAKSTLIPLSSVEGLFFIESEKDHAKETSSNDLIRKVIFKCQLDSVGGPTVSLDSGLTFSLERGEIQIEKKNSISVFYSPQTIMFEKDNFLTEAFSKLFASGVSSILAFKKESFVDGNEWYYVCDPELGHLSAEFQQQLSLLNIGKTGGSSKPVSSFSMDSGFVLSKVEQLSIFEIADKIISDWFSTHNVTAKDRLAIAATELSEAFDNQKATILKGLFIDTPVDPGILKQIGAIFKNDTPSALVDLFREDLPITALKSAIGLGKIVSPSLAKILIGPISTTPIIDASSRSLEEANTFFADPNLAGRNLLSIGQPSVIKEAIDNGQNTNAFLFPYKPGDESLNLTLEDSLSLLYTHSLFGNFAGGMVRNDAIVFGGDMYDLTSAKQFMRHIEANSSISRKAVFSIKADQAGVEELTQSIHKNIEMGYVLFNDPSEADRYYVFIAHQNFRDWSSHLASTEDNVSLSVSTKADLYAKLSNSFNSNNTVLKRLHSSARSFSTFLSSTAGDKEMGYFRKNLLETTSNGRLKAIREFTEKKSLIEQIRPSAILGVISAANIPIDDKVFPDVIHVNSNVKYSLKDIYKNPILSNRFLQIPGFSETVQYLLKQNNMKVPAVSPFVLDLVNFENNELPEQDKDLVVSHEENLGILNYKYLPSIIDISTLEKKNAFIKFVGLTIAMQKEINGEDVDHIDILDQVNRNIRSSINEGQYVLLKTETTYLKKEGSFKNIEVFTVANKQLKDIATLGVSPLHFLKTVKDHGVFAVSDRAKSVTMKTKVAKRIFSGILDFLKTAYAKYEHDFIPEEVKSLLIKAAEISHSNSVIAQDMKSKIYNGMLKKTSFVKIVENTIGSPKDPRKIVDQVLHEAVSDGFTVTSFSDDKARAESFLEKFFYTSPKTFFNGKNAATYKEAFDSFFSATEYSHLLWSHMSEYAKYDSDIEKAVMKVFDSFATLFDMEMVESSKYDENEKAIHRNRVINIFLSDLLGLNPHQILEVKGYLAMNLDGQKSTELPFWEMRTGKTRTMLSINALLSMVHKQSSIFFIQGKNYDDIVSQFWDTNPLILSESGVFIGEQNLFEKNNYAFPFPISDDLFPNIPALLKKELLSPDEDPTHPAERLGRDFLSFYGQIKAKIPNDRDTVHAKLLSLTAGNAPLNKLFDHQAFNSDLKVYKDAAATIYYLQYLFDNKFLDQNSKTMSAIKKKIFDNFFGKMIDEKKRYSAQAEGNVIFAGKQFVENFSANDNQPNKLFKSSRMTLTSSVDIKKSDRKTMEFYSSTHDMKGEPDGGRLWDFYSREFFDCLEAPDQFVGSKTTYAQLPFMLDGSKNALAALDQVLRIASARLDKELADYDFAQFEDIFSGSEIDQNSIKDFIKLQIPSVVKFIATKIKGEFNGVIDTKRPYDVITVNGEIHEGSAFDLSKINFEEALIPALQMASVANPKNAISRLKSEVFKSHKVALEISTASFIWSVKELFMAHKNRHFEKRVAAVFGKKINADYVSLTTNLSKEAWRVVFPSKVASLPDGSKVNKIDCFDFATDANSESLPHVFSEQSVFPRSVVYTLRSTEVLADITKAVIPGEDQVSNSSGRFTRSNNASYFWSINPDNQIASISIDEAHKNTSNQKSFQLKSLLDSVEKLYPSGSKLIATGTPLAGLKSFTKLIETISGADGVGFSSTILKYCGNFKFKRVFAAALYTAFKNDVEFFAQYSQLMLDSFDKAEYDSSRTAMVFGSAKVNNIMNFVWGADPIKAVFAEGGELSGVMVTKRESERAQYEIIEETLKEFFRISKDAEGNKLEFMMNATWEAATKKNSIITVQAPGFNNPLGLSTFLGFLNKANVSIRRPSKDIFYDVLDKDYLSNYSHPSSALVTEDERTLTRGVLGAEFILKKYQTYYQVYKIRETLSLLFGMVADAMRTEPTKYGFSSYGEAGRVLNRSQISVEDSIEDLYARFLNNNGVFSTAIDPDKERALFDIIHFVDGIILDKSFFQDRYHESRIIEDDRFSFDCRGINMSLAKSFASQIDFHHISHSSAEIYFGDTPVNASADAIRIIIDKGTPCFQENGALMPVRFSFPLSVIVDERLPALKFTYNAANPDDNTILETMAFIKDTKELVKTHMDNGENIRLMTTRVAITGAALLANIAAALDRVDDSNNFNIVVNITDMRVNDLINDIYKVAGTLLDDKKVKIYRAIPSSINSTLTELRARKEQISVTGNYESLAEGFDMEFVDTGFYLGAVRKTAPAIQSFARQIGFSKKVSSFYLANNGRLATLNGHIEQATAKKSLLKAAVSLSDADISDKTGNSVFNYAVTLSKKGVTVAPSEIVTANLASYQELLSYEHFMNGALVSNEPIDEQSMERWYKSEVRGKVAAPTAKAVIKTSSKEIMAGALISKRF